MPSGITHPIRGCTPHYKDIDTKEQQLKVHRLHQPKFEFQPTNTDQAEEITLTEGSFLYFPGTF